MVNRSRHRRVRTSPQPFPSVIMKHSGTALAVFALLAAHAIPSTAADEPAACSALDDDGSRLACYDRAAGRAMPMPVK